MSNRQATTKRRRWKRFLYGGILLAVLVPAWLLFAPGPLGGEGHRNVRSDLWPGLS
jgi:hypothetical protein